MGENISKYRNLHQRNVSLPVFFQSGTKLHGLRGVPSTGFLDKAN